LTIAALIATASGAAAQDAGAPQLAVVAGAERDRFTYRFTSPSSFDTAALVPHFFEQRYVADNLWVGAAVRYRAGVAWRTTAGLTPSRDAVADDYDTFINPDGSVIVSGTTGGVSIQSFRFRQQAEIGRVRAMRFAVAYALRVDRVDFGLGHRTVTRNGVLIEATDVTTREFTSSQVHTFAAAIGADRHAGPRWRLSVDGEVSPSTVGRLLVQLPDKYPGQDLVFLAKAASARGTVAMTRPGRWPIRVAVDAGRTWSYHSEDALARTSLGVSCAIGIVGTASARRPQSKP
jgi:hypothetical protein